MQHPIDFIQALGTRDKERRHYSHLQNRFSLRNYFRMAKEIRALLFPGASILDWGCGFGQVSYFLETLGLAPVPYDLGESVSLTENFLRQLGLTVIRSNDSSLIPFPDRHFDAVLSCGVLEHVDVVDQSLAEVLRVLKSGGFFFIFMLPNELSLIEYINTALGISDHPVKFTFSSIETLLRKHHFSVVSRNRGNLIPKCLRALPLSLDQLITRLYQADKKWLRLERALLEFPGISQISGTLEIVAKRGS